MKVAALAGGVGGAKLVQGLAAIIPPSDLTIIVNTGDDFTHLGLRICPDIDTICYSLAGMVNTETGWGRAGETWNALHNLITLGEPGWFQVGDADLATHLARTQLLAQGRKLSEIIGHFCRAWNIEQSVLPMTNNVVTTQIQQEDGAWIDFQDYFVRQSWQPIVRKIRFDLSEQACPAAGVIEAIDEADLIVICPSNPLVSIDPILSIPGIHDHIQRKPKIAISPIIGDRAVKGPLAKIIRELFGINPSATWVADYYHEKLNLTGFILDQTDHEQMIKLNGKGIICKETQSLMTTLTDRIHLAKEVISFGELLTTGIR